MKLSSKDKKQLAKAISKELKEDNKVAKALKNNKKKLKMKVKVSTFIDPKTKKKKVGGCVELIETKSDIAFLDGINLDLGLTTDYKDFLLGISKDIDLPTGNGEKEFSIGVYVDAINTSKQLINKFIKKKDTNLDIKFKVGISKVF